MVIPFTKGSLGLGLRQAQSSLGNNKVHLPFELGRAHRQASTNAVGLAPSP